VVVIASLFVLGFTILYIGGGGGSPLAPRYVVKALMGDVNGLKAGAPVRLGGVEVGTVTRVDFAGGAGGLVEVTMRLDRRVERRVTTESRATLGSLGLLGEKAVDIQSAATGTPVQDGGYLPAAGEDPVKGLLTDASDSTEHLKRILARMDSGEGTIGKAIRDEELYTRMADVSMRLQGLMSKLESEKGPLGRLVNDGEMSQRMADSMRRVSDVLSRIDSGQGALGVLSRDDELGRDLKSLAKSLDLVTGRLARGEGTAGRLLQDDELGKRIESLTKRLDGVLARVESGEGTAGRLVQDPELYNNLNAALKEMRQLVADVRHDPQKYLRVKVSLF
ncbi:MAG TPA: MlaD family protein, partial [Vicinamibacteria bacterium]|nr:MlaD family protein [Vicinamibacteria bacterium]